MDTDAEGVSTPAWWTTPEVRCLAERIVAAEAERRVYAAVVGDIREDRYDGSVDGSGCRVVEPGTGMWGDTDNTLLEVSKHEEAGAADDQSGWVGCYGENCPGQADAGGGTSRRRGGEVEEEGQGGGRRRRDGWYL